MMVQSLRLRQYSHASEHAYLSWVMRFESFLEEKSLPQVTDEDLRRFLTHLTVERSVAAATQKLAFNALLYFYRNVLRVEINSLATVVPSHVPRRLPTVLSPADVRRVISCLSGTYRLMALLLYGSGLRLSECLALRVKDIDFQRQCVTVRGGKGDKDRQTVLPLAVCDALHRHLEKARAVYEKDRRDKVDGVAIPGALSRKLTSASTDWAWYWVFPADRPSIDPFTRVPRRYHVYPTTLQRAFREAVRASGISMRATIHTLRTIPRSGLLPSNSILPLFFRLKSTPSRHSLTLSIGPRLKEGVDYEVHR